MTAVQSPTQFTIELKTRFSDLANFQEQWDRAVLDLNGPIHMSFDWLRTWSEFYCDGKQIRLFIFRDGERIVGLVPIYIEQVGFAPCKLRVARLIGSAIPPKVFDPPVDATWAKQIWGAVLNQLFQKDGCDLLTVGMVSQEYVGTAALTEACREQASLVQPCESTSNEVRTMYELPDNFLNYFESINSKEKKIRKKKMRDLEEMGYVRTEIVKDPAAVAAAFEEFAKVHTTQWQAEGRTGHFHAWPRGLDYNRALVQAHGARGRVYFFKLWVGEQVATWQYTFAFGKTLYAELPARLSDPQWHRYSLGCTSQIKLIEAAIAEGFQRMDSGLGHYEYKILTNGVEAPVFTHRIVSASALRRAKIAFYKKFAVCYRIALHKIWYRRITPLLPAKWRRGQSESLMAFDF